MFRPLTFFDVIPDLCIRMETSSGRQALIEQIEKMIRLDHDCSEHAIHYAPGKEGVCDHEGCFYVHPDVPAPCGRKKLVDCLRALLLYLRAQRIQDAEILLPATAFSLCRYDPNSQ